jgi:hypothetical protein
MISKTLIYKNLFLVVILTTVQLLQPVKAQLGSTFGSSQSQGSIFNNGTNTNRTRSIFRNIPPSTTLGTTNTSNAADSLASGLNPTTNNTFGTPSTNNQNGGGNTTFGDPGGPGGGGGGSGDINDLGVPFDGGLSVLLAFGIGQGFKRRKKILPSSTL